MYAIVRQYEYDPARRAELGAALSEVQALHAGQPGYAGSVVVDDGRRLIALNLWHTEQAAAAGRTAIGADVRRALAPLTAGPSELVAVGEVVAGELGRWSAAASAET